MSSFVVKEFSRIRGRACTQGQAAAEETARWRWEGPGQEAGAKGGRCRTGFTREDQEQQGLAALLGACFTLYDVPNYDPVSGNRQPGRPLPPFPVLRVGKPRSPPTAALASTLLSTC